ncbi:hypothetical protein NL676_008330 [Syzygium grande]|nr:hypothetical protein NL676_008330 [Syzygium grande]
MRSSTTPPGLQTPSSIERSGWITLRMLCKLPASSSSRHLVKARPGGRGYDFILLVVESFRANGRPFAIATTNGSQTFMNADYLQTFPSNVTDVFTGILYFTSGLVWEWTGNGSAQVGLITGISDYIRLTAGWAYKGWPRRGLGLTGDDRYAVTANFLEYCEGLRRGFVSDVNAMMIDSYSDAYFVELLGTSVNELWEEYKQSKNCNARSLTALPGFQKNQFRKYVGTEYGVDALLAAAEFVLKTFGQSERPGRDYDLCRWLSRSSSPTADPSPSQPLTDTEST